LQLITDEATALTKVDFGSFFNGRTSAAEHKPPRAREASARFDAAEHAIQAHLAGTGVTGRRQSRSAGKLLPDHGMPEGHLRSAE
jgi:hypothetical protein